MIIYRTEVAGIIDQANVISGPRYIKYNNSSIHQKTQAALHEQMRNTTERQRWRNTFNMRFSQTQTRSVWRATIALH